MNRKCGVLLPVSSLPSPYGIGSFSKEAYVFVDFLKEAGQTYWQILPLGQTGYGDSPYQSFSTFAGNPYFIDLDALIVAGYITKEEVKEYDFGEDAGLVDYEKIYNARFPILYRAYCNSPYAKKLYPRWAGKEYDGERIRFEAFIQHNADWLPDYALFCAVKNQYGGCSYIEWNEDIRLRQKEAMKKKKKELSGEIRFYEFQQYLFFEQWMALKSYANEKGIRIIGDIPIYVAFDSADTWSHPELFCLDENGYPTKVAGCPPDAFSATGQLWGNPIYQWEYHASTGYAWWIRRMEHIFTLCDIVRIDHFRGFESFYAVPYGNETAENGTWQKGPGYDLFLAMDKALGKKPVIAEDLGYITNEVRELVRKTGYPGMKVLQFAFDSRDGGANDYLPHFYGRNCVVYTGTHDNETMRGWYTDEAVDPADRAVAREYADVDSDEGAALSFIRIAMMSVADTCIIPLQDYLNLGNEARINTPSTLGGNWVWRMQPDACTKALSEKMRSLAISYGRMC